MKKAIAAAVTGAVFFVSGCSPSDLETQKSTTPASVVVETDYPEPVDGFAHEGAKLLAWNAYQCDQFRRQLPEVTSFSLGVDIDLGLIPQDEMDEAQEALDLLELSGRTGDALHRDVETNMCDGWLWEWKKGRDNYMDAYHRFTFEDARAAGLVAE